MLSSPTVEIAMRVTREQMAEHRERILDSAGKLFRAKGFEAVTVADVMQAAGLTHGGFYGHFKSKDDLIAATLMHALKPKDSERDLAAFTKRYLSPRHRDDFAGGCSTAGLAAETIRQAPAARAAMTAGLRDTIERLSHGAPGETGAARRRAAIGHWSAMVGALVLARLSDDLNLSDEILDEARAWLEAQEPRRAKPARRARSKSH
jgi:TetR/AcrR family transcriptional repressor of nem operon